MEPIRIGFVGAGLMSNQHAASIVRGTSAVIGGVFGADEAQRAAFAEAYDCTAHATLDALLADATLDAVLVATPTDTHVPIALQALAAGKHVFVEKPVARDLDGALELRDAARDAGLVVGVGHVVRYFAEYRRLHELVRGGEIGTPTVATLGRRCQQPDWAPDAWHTDMARSGGVTVDMMVHDIDLARWFFGEPDTVYARVVGSDVHDGLDYALATLTWADVTICHLHGSWAEPDGFSQSAEICGTTGMLTYDSRGTDDLQFATHAGAAGGVTALPEPPVGPADPFARQMGDFAAAVRTGAAMPGDIDWAIGSLRIALAMLESSDTGRTVSLTPLANLLQNEVPA